MYTYIFLCTTGNPLDLFINYFEIFAEKACCFKDLYQFLPLIQNEYISLLSSTWALIKKTNDGEVKNVRIVNFYTKYVFHSKSI